jgi:hypothetical protein
VNIEEELAALKAKEEEAERIWAGGPRSFNTGGGIGVVKEYGCKADDLTHGLPVCHAVRKDKSGTIVRDGSVTYRLCDDGRKTTVGGRAIIDSREQRELHKKRWGMEEG